ncbi:hypothetical protein SEA_LOSER_90 [Mycobacterium phage Loser]|uniref:hypothetical protein n=1 Tax=Mycobacterium phage Loser TaxID=1815969 RepID=UPI00078E9570|nr:hypothetical protein SEA_LOSER_90 [Mycobacterium phage Loser]AMS00986.1 hypothetical protein SEA_LOSER_90 [Mycobacterium phage Loser]
MYLDDIELPADEAPPTAYEEITPHDFALGDIVWHFGMRLRIVTEPRETNHPKNEYSPTIAARAVIENWDDVKDFVGNLADVDSEGRRTWTVQGNGLARYSREVKA